MTLSTIASTVLVSSTGTSDPYELFNNHNRIFKKGDKLIDGDRVWERHGDDLTAPIYNTSDTYKKCDIVSDTVLKRITGFGDSVKSVEEYSGYDTSLSASDWTHRYLKLDLSEFIVAGGDYYYKEVKNGAWYEYTAVTTAGGTVKVLTGKYQISTCSNSGGDESRYIEKRGDDYYIHFETIIYDHLLARVGEEQSATCGHTYSVTRMHYAETGEPILMGYEMDTNKHSYYLSVGDWAHYDSTPNLSGDDIPVIVHEPRLWEARRAYKQGDILYIRTNVNAPVEYNTGTGAPTFETIEHLTTDWGWTDIAPISKTAPFDLLAGTTAKFSATASWTAKPQGKFDTIAFSKLFASKVTIQIGSWQTVLHPRCKYTQSGKDYYFPASEVVYLSKSYPANTTVTITIDPLNGEGEVGMMAFGDKVKLGATIAEFESAPKDFSLYEQQEWGNVLYVERVKLNRIEYSIDIDTDDYDFALKVLTSLTGKMVIIDGNDGETDRSFQSATMIGRFRSPRASTKVENGELSRISRATFSAEEIA